MTSIPLKTSDISVIIPTLDEAARIETLADTLRGRVGEVILVDGGSADDTGRLAEAQGFTVLTQPPGRARQMNAGARRARGAVLLFLHADTVVPAGFADRIATALSDTTISLCAFSLGVDTDSPLLRAVVGLANLRSRLLRLPYGDQALALRTAIFNELGGFPDTAIMEDYELVRKAGRFGTVLTLNDRVLTSDRRWRRLGVLQTTLINQLVVIGYKIGVRPERLASLYRTGLVGGK